MAVSKGAFRTWEKRVRGALRSALSHVLALLRGRSGPARLEFDPATIHRVLVVRMNTRMGNTLFMAPLLTALHEVLPHADIDVLVRYPDAADVLRGLPGLRNVMTLPHKSWSDPRKLFSTARACRANRYDLAIDPVPNSSGGRLGLLLSGARWRLGFDDSDQWLRLDYAADLPPGVRHEALRPLALLQQAFGYTVVPGQARLRIANDADELVAGARLFQQRLALADPAPRDGRPVIGFFASARGPKDLGPQWWQNFWATYLSLHPQALPLEVLPTAGATPVNADFATVHCASPRMLAATIRNADWFFSADTGPMHLASASGVPTIAFFDQTNPDAFGPIKLQDTVLKIGGQSAAKVAQACAAIVNAAGRSPAR
jgi:ADP-heptose:LPS heptosyltransferase